MTRRIAIVVGLAGALALAAWWLAHDRSPHDARRARRPSLTSPRRLDVAAFRAQLAARRAAVREIQRRHPRTAPRHDGKPTSLGRSLMTPQCILGPADLCAALDESVLACDDGDTSACLAVGQYLQDTPPRPTVAIVFFHYACKGGDAAGCARMAELRSDASPPIACEADPFACTWRATRTMDDDLFDQACALGVADACAHMIMLTEDDPAAARPYLETACQLGNPMACSGLGRQLSPDCRENCYPPDPATAAAALTIACEAGFTEACEGALP